MSRDFKRLDELTQIDESHLLLGQVTGRTLDLNLLYRAVESIELAPAVPEDIRGQFNVARNMAVYTYFCYALAPEVQLKTFTVIELALRRRAGEPKGKTLRPLLKLAVSEHWIRDSGFRHIEKPLAENPYCHSLIDTLPALRNDSAHGSTSLTPDSVWYLERCADLVNQLFDSEPMRKERSVAV
jgi:hypothetical protein